MAGARPVLADFVWAQDLQFRATSGSNSLLIDGDSLAGPSPVQLMVFALASCMSIDLVDILRRGRHSVTACRSSIHAERASEAPRRVLSVTLHFVVEGHVPARAIERAISLSRNKYCSVWHSMRQDIVLLTSFEGGRTEVGGDRETS